MQGNSPRLLPPILVLSIITNTTNVAEGRTRIDEGATEVDEPGSGGRADAARAPDRIGQPDFPEPLSLLP